VLPSVNAYMDRLRKFNIRPFHWLLMLAVGISIGISLAHFFVPHDYLAIHGFLRRTYYVPVILTGLLCGFRQAIYLVAFIVAAYLPFVLLQWPNHTLPSNLEEIYEIVMLAVVGGLTGILSDRERKRRQELQEAYQDTVIRLAMAAEYRDGNTGAHLRRISRYAEVIAKNMGISADRAELIKLATPMHDIGKVGIPDHVLLNSGKLNHDEWNVMQTHPDMGYEILKESHSALLEMAAQIALAHHERFDGSGYPKGLRGDEIPLEARIVAVADVFDALTTSRTYKPGYGVEESIEKMKKDVGTHFDPRVFEAFVQGLDEIKNIKGMFEKEPSNPHP
jgi:HD-GYP domain-containing protein (c-di-GMP phosphodiesterase class II)